MEIDSLICQILSNIRFTLNVSISSPNVKNWSLKKNILTFHLKRERERYPYPPPGDVRGSYLCGIHNGPTPGFGKYEYIRQDASTVLINRLREKRAANIQSTKQQQGDTPKK